jgi:glyoxylase-like metal-dependent hydrolase (beta-lactamase superfamily II)/ketosteroid isomerase-like protein
MATQEQRASTAESRAVVERYFDAIARRDIDAAVACWHPGGREHVRGIIDAPAPEGVRAFLGDLMAAVPDLDFRLVALVAEDDRCVAQWRARGTFAGEPFLGFEATGARLDLEGADVLVVREGRIASNDAFSDGLTFARQAGLFPEQGSAQDIGMQRAVNARTRMSRRLHAAEPEQIAQDVWIVRGGLPTRTMNVFLVRDGSGVLVFDGGIAAMTRAVAAAGARLGGITRVVLGHSHADHRGVAASLEAPVECHEAEKADAEGDGGWHYFDFSKLNRAGRVFFPRALKTWDGGPVTVSRTLREGDEVAGFEVVHLPGHAPGLIGLWRGSDRLALVSDCFYTLDPQTGRKGHPRVPHAAFNLDTGQARESMRKLARLQPAAAWPGHADALTGDVAAQLEHAAATT